MPLLHPVQWQIKNYWVLIISKFAEHAEKYADVKQSFIPHLNVFSLKQFSFPQIFFELRYSCVQKYVHILM